MDRLYKFAEKAIETAGTVGAEKRRERRLSDIRAEAGLTARHRMTEAGRETRHEREYGAPDIGDPGGFRYAELASKKAASTRLSAANQVQIRKQQLEDYDIKTEALFSPHMEYGPEGEAALPPHLRNIYNVGRAMSLNDPEGAQKYIKAEITAYKKSAGQKTRMGELGGLSKEQLSAYEQSLLGGGQADVGALSDVGPPGKVPAWGATKASKRFGLSQRATTLATAYEKEHPTPIIGAETLGRFREAWRTRKESPYVTIGR